MSAKYEPDVLLAQIIDKIIANGSKSAADTTDEDDD